MNPNLCIAVSLPTLRALLDYQAGQDDHPDPAALADAAIRDWLQRQHQQARPAGQRGYLWKTLFLPEGTRLRTASHHGSQYASIEGDELVYNAMTMSPNQFAQAGNGNTRSAWDAISIQLPGERAWQPVARLRDAQAAQARRTANRPAAAAPPTPTTLPVPPCAPTTSAPARQLTGTNLLPQLRPDRTERRQTYRRAEDLLLD